MSNSKEVFAVIMAGGVGTRFWPMSRTSKPKQFLDILGTGQSLIQMTFDRLKSSVPRENILVVTNEMYRGKVEDHLSDLPKANILCESAMRNTAPCIAYANAVISSRTESGNPAIVVAPSDHLIFNTGEFSRILGLAFEESLTHGGIVTMGIKPSRPDTGYGYIKYRGNSEVAEVEEFTEKPDLATAEKMLASGDYCWNSGIFIWSLETIEGEFEKHLPEMTSRFKSAELNGTKGEVDVIYEGCESISIDYGILEKASEVKVVPSDFGWSDLGTWNSLANHLGDDQGNKTSGVEVIATDSSGNIIVGSDKKTIAIKGLNDTIIVDTKDALLICPKTDEQWVKELVAQLKDKK